MRTTLIVDGYNVINAWAELIDLKDCELSQARDKLAEILANFGAYKDYEVIIVYDAYAISGDIVREENLYGLAIYYTAEGETADSYIERTAYNLVRDRKRVFVVTSDWAQQMTILGAGAYRKSARELREEVKIAHKEMNGQYTKNIITCKRQELGDRIDSAIAKKLDDMRKGK